MLTASILPLVSCAGPCAGRGRALMQPVPEGKPVLCRGGNVHVPHCAQAMTYQARERSATA